MIFVNSIFKTNFGAPLYQYCRKKIRPRKNTAKIFPRVTMWSQSDHNLITIWSLFYKIHENIQGNKLNKLLKEHQPKQDHEKVIFNYSNISLSDAEKSLLVKGLKFSISPKKLNYADYLANFELFYRSIYNLDSISNKILDFVKTKIKDTALTSFRNYKANLPRNLSGEDFKALQNLSKNTNLVIQKSDKKGIQ